MEQWTSHSPWERVRNARSQACTGCLDTHCSLRITGREVRKDGLGVRETWIRVLTALFCDLEQFPSPFCASVSSPANGIIMSTGLKVVGGIQLNDVALCSVQRLGAGSPTAGTGSRGPAGHQAVLERTVGLCGPGSPCLPTRAQLPIQSNPAEPKAQVERVAPLYPQPCPPGLRWPAPHLEGSYSISSTETHELVRHSPPLSQGKSRVVSWETSFKNCSLETVSPPGPGFLGSGPCSFQQCVLALVRTPSVFDGSLKATGEPCALLPCLPPQGEVPGARPGREHS